MYNLKTPPIQKLVNQLVAECDEYFNLNISSTDEKYKKFVQDYDNIVKNTEAFRPNTQTEVNVTETTLKKLRKDGWDNVDDPALMKYEKDNSGVFNLKGGKTKLYDSGIYFKGRTFQGQSSKENASVGLYERLKNSSIVFSDTEENGVIFYRDAGTGFEQDFSNEKILTYEEWLTANNLGQGTTAGDDFTEDYKSYLSQQKKNTFVPVSVKYTEAKWIMFKDNDNNKDNNNKILVNDEKLWPNDFFPDKPKVNTYGELYKWLFNTEYGSIYYDEKSVDYWSNPNLETGTNGPVSTKTSGSTQADLTAFGLMSPSITGVITGTDIELIVTNVTDVSKLIAVFSTSNGSTVKVGTTVQVSGETENNFSSPVAYTVIAEDGVNLSTYNVSVKVAINPESTGADITAFSFSSPSVTAVINNTSILLTVPISTDISALVATFTSSNNSVVKVGSTIQISGTTANNFIAPVYYTVIAGNGIDLSTYIVTVTRSFLVPDSSGTSGTGTSGTSGTGTSGTSGTSGNNLFNPEYYAKGSTTPQNSKPVETGEKFDLVTGLAYKSLKKSPIDYIPTKISNNIKSNIYQNDIFNELNTNRISLMTYKKFDFGKTTITSDVFAKRVVDLYLEKFDNALILNEWNAKIANDYWSNGLKNKIDEKSDIGIKHFIAREYPYKLEYYGDDSFFEIDNPWKDTTTLYDLLVEVVKEKNPELVKQPGVPLVPKFKPMIMIGEKEIFVFDGETKKDLPNFSIYVGDPNKWPVREGIQKEADDGNMDIFDDILDEEYLEEDSIASKEEDIKIVNAAEDCTQYFSNPETPNAVGAFNPQNITPVTSLDALIDRAGQCIVSLGYTKTGGRLTAAHMKMGYTDKIHGLCPLGTQVMCFAMIGDWKSSGGNGDGYSFKSGAKSVLDSRYYNSKVRPPGWSSGGGKPSYFTDSKQWQIGDVIAIGYKGQAFGHIQVWTGIKWMSDFKQVQLQQPSINDYETVALWRLNEKGIAAVKKNTPLIK